MNNQTIMTNVFTRENITFAIAVVGFILSLWNFLKDFYNNRSKVKLNCKLCTAKKNSAKSLIYLQLSIENCSRLPISISRIFLEYDGKSSEFGWIPEIILEKTRRTGNVVTDDRKYCSEQLPHTIEGLGVWGGFFYVHYPYVLCEDKFINSPKFLKLYTNRGVKILKLDISHNNFNSDIKYI